MGEHLGPSEGDLNLPATWDLPRTFTESPACRDPLGRVPGQLGSPVRRFPSSHLCAPDQHSPQPLAGHHPSLSTCCDVLWAGLWLPQSLAPNAQVHWQLSLDLSTFSARLWVPGGQELCLVLSHSVLSPSAALTARSRDAAGGCEWLRLRGGGRLAEHWATCSGSRRQQPGSSSGDCLSLPFNA